MGTQAYKCAYDKLSDKKPFKHTLLGPEELAKKTKGKSEGEKHLTMAAVTYPASIVTNNEAIAETYDGEIFFTKTGQTCIKNSKPVYRATSTLCKHDQGTLGKLACQGVDLLKTTGDLAATVKPNVDCKKIIIGDCYEHGKRISPIGGSFPIHIDADDEDSLKIFDYLRYNPDRHKNDSIPS